MGEIYFRVFFEKVCNSKLQAEIIQWNAHSAPNKYVFFSVARAVDRWNKILSVGFLIDYFPLSTRVL